MSKESILSVKLSQIEILPDLPDPVVQCFQHTFD